MVRRGKGWYGEKQRHREAALKGMQRRQAQLPWPSRPRQGRVKTLDSYAEDYVDGVADAIEDKLNEKWFWEDVETVESEEELGDQIGELVGDEIVDELAQTIAEENPELSGEEIETVTTSAAEKAIYIIAKCAWEYMKKGE